MTHPGSGETPTEQRPRQTASSTRCGADTGDELGSEGPSGSNTGRAPAPDPGSLLGSGSLLGALLWWLPGLAVAVGAAAATVHGLYEVAVASRVPAGIAWLYPLITDGLALVAYAATARLHGPAARYAWSVVGLAAGLSGLAQATYLAHGPAVEVPAALRFGVGAWPAIAAAIVAHLLYLLATTTPSVQRPSAHVVHSDTRDVQPFTPAAAGPNTTGVQASTHIPAVQPDPASQTSNDEPGRDRVTPAPARAAPSPALDRARAAATRHAGRHGTWPTVSQLEAAAEVSRGTAATALKTLRERPPPLHLITDTGQENPNHHDPNHDHAQP